MSLNHMNLLTRAEVSRKLLALGYPVTERTLESLAVARKGPPYAKWGNRAMYSWEQVAEWAERRCTTAMPAGRVREDT